MLTQSLFRALGREWDVNGVKGTRRKVCMGVRTPPDVEHVGPTVREAINIQHIVNS